MKIPWLSNSLLLKSEKWFGIIMVLNTLVLIAMVSMAKSERPLFLYKKIHGHCKDVNVEYITYQMKTTISFYSTVIYYYEKPYKIDKLVLGYVLKDNYSLTSSKEIEAWYYTIRGVKKIKELHADGNIIRKYNSKVGIMVYITSLITLILEIFMLRWYKKFK